MVIEYLNGHVQHPIEMGVQRVHNERADFLVMHPTDNRVLKGVAKWTVANIVEQNSQTSTAVLFFGDDHALFPK